MRRYLFINLLVNVFPLALSFDKKVHFYTHWPAVGAAIVLVGLVYVIWDTMFARRGYWSFSTTHVGSRRLFDLPVEEILFFVTVPYACLFILESLRSYFADQMVNLPLWVFPAAAGVMILGAVFSRSRPYSTVVLLVTAGFLLLARFLTPTLLTSRLFWIYMGLTYLPFAIVNGVLTAVPVVIYNPKAIWGPRVYTIPLEDFFYSFSMLGLSAMVYTTVGRWL